MTDEILFSGIPFSGIPFKGFSLFKSKWKPCPICLKVGDRICAEINDKDCQAKMDEYKDGKIKFAQFISFLREKYPERAMELYIKSFLETFNNKNEE